MSPTPYSRVRNGGVRPKLFYGPLTIVSLVTAILTPRKIVRFELGTAAQANIRRDDGGDDVFSRRPSASSLGVSRCFSACERSLLSVAAHFRFTDLCPGQRRAPAMVRWDGPRYVVRCDIVPGSSANSENPNQIYFSRRFDHRKRAQSFARRHIKAGYLVTIEHRGGLEYP